MNAVLQPKDLPAAIGAAFEGGFFFGRIAVDRNPHAVIVSAKATGEHSATRWNKGLARVAGATSYYDSYLNTKAMAEAGSEIAQWALEKRINGFADWCIPARDVLEMLHRHGKPTASPNGGWYRDGENPSSIPVGYPYTEALPAQTVVEQFRTNGQLLEGMTAEAFEPAWYWSSTQYEGDADCAWAQGFGNGFQYYYHKDLSFRVRLVRMIPI